MRRASLRGNRRWRTVLPGLVLALTAASFASAQEVTVSVNSKEIYAGLPFIISVSAKGFEEQPEPQASAMEIPGCSVSFLGVSPNVSSFISVVNGRRVDRRDVTFVFRYRVMASEAGEFTVPAITLQQGTKEATTRPGTLRAREVPVSDDMKLMLVLPARPVWVGETFPITIDWYLRRDVSDQSFVVPLFEREDLLDVSPPPGKPTRQVLSFPAGARDIRLPFERESTTLEGEAYTRFRVRALGTPTRPGLIDPGPARVLARIHVGTGRDRFGFRVPRTKLFKAEAEPKKLDVKAIPEEGRPESFSGAVGTGFAIEVQADRTVVRLGDPITLDVTLRGDGRLEGLGLPRLDSDGGLSADLFSFPEESPPGETLDDRGKRFRVTVRVRSEGAREIPAIPFSFFNPVTGAYQTVRSRPIALSVKGSSLVGAEDVVTGAAETGAPPGEEVRVEVSHLSPAASLVGANLSLSDPGRTLQRARGIPGALPLLVLLYVGPLVLLGWRLWSLRTREGRAAARDSRRARRACLAAIDEASRVPAREGAPRVASALRALRRLLGLSEAEGEGLLRDLEVAAFDPTASAAPLSGKLAEEAREVVGRWQRKPASGGRQASMMVWTLALGAALGIPQDSEEHRLREARKAYAQGMTETDRDRRVESFALAEALFGEIARAHPESPDLLADWGNAALGAQEIGTAVLAFRRTLRLEPGHPRARMNLAWARRRMPQWVPVPERTGALDSFFLRVHSLSVPRRLIGGGVAFALAVLLIIPWGRQKRLLRRLAILPVLLWMGLAFSVFLDLGVSGGAVLLRDGVPLRSADSSGAPPVLGHPLPAGVEVTALESRDAWTRIELADGTAGWLPTTSLAAVE